MNNTDLHDIDLSDITIPGYDPNKPSLFGILWKSKIIRFLTIILVLVLLLIAFLATFMNHPSIQ